MVQNISLFQIDFLKSLNNPDRKIKQLFFALLWLFTDIEIESTPKRDIFGNIDLSMSNVAKLMKNPVKFKINIQDLVKLVPKGKVKYDNFVKAWKIIEEEELTVEMLNNKSNEAGYLLACVIEICKIGLLKKK